MKRKRNSENEEKPLKPFWDNRCKTISIDSWLLDDPDIIEECNPNYSESETHASSWFKIIEERILYEKDISFLKDIELEKNQSQKKTSNDSVKKKKQKRPRPERYDFIQLKRKEKSLQNGRILVDSSIIDVWIISMKNENYENTELHLVLDLPYDTRGSVVMEFLKNFKTCIKVFKTKKIKFEMKFKSKKRMFKQTIPILHRDFNRSGVCSFLKDIITSEPLPKIEHDFEIMHNKLGEWYFLIPVSIGKRKSKKGIVALDPGVRTFMTGYDPSGRVFHYGVNDIDKISRLCVKYDKYQSDRDRALGRINKRKRFKLRKKMYRIVQKIHNLVDECHHKLAKYLCFSTLKYYAY
ncbi:21419_t:CDS:2 [Racocetra persica]|uniref:21419_t:CDS:1 n=1 Tax=Racocetra persica TaxID=160502 RepID=A0ACA9LQ94_9GLOM|nr:21419_t:CDS:2 [Racocetra persica]